MNNPNSNSTQSLGSLIQGIPFLYKLIALTTVVSGIFSLFTGLFLTLLANYPYYTLFYFNVWRYFTSFLVADSLLGAIFSLVVLWFTLPLIERNVSTVVTAVDILTNNAAIQIVYVLFWLIVYFISEEYSQSMVSSGVWGVWIVFLVRICQSDPAGNIKFCCFPFTIKKRIYPLAIIGIIALLNFSLPLDMIIGYLIGYIQCNFLNGTLFRFKADQYQQFENTVFKFAKDRPDFKRFADSEYAQAFTRESSSTYAEFYGNFIANADNGANREVQQNYNLADNVGSTNFDTMKGGVAIGESPTEPNNPIENSNKNWGNAELSPSKQSSVKPPAGYAVFEDDNN